VHKSTGDRLGGRCGKGACKGIEMGIGRRERSMGRTREPKEGTSPQELRVLVKWQHKKKISHFTVSNNHVQTESLV
jgi:hypothetical protein